MKISHMKVSILFAIQDMGNCFNSNIVSQLNLDREVIYACEAA